MTCSAHYVGLKAPIKFLRFGIRALGGVDCWWQGGSETESSTRSKSHSLNLNVRSHAGVCTTQQEPRQLSLAVRSLLVTKINSIACWQLVYYALRAIRTTGLSPYRRKCFCPHNGHSSIRIYNLSFSFELNFSLHFHSSWLSILFLDLNVKNQKLLLPYKFFLNIM